MLSRHKEVDRAMRWAFLNHGTHKESATSAHNLQQLVAEFLQGPSTSSGNRTALMGNSFGRLRLMEDLPPLPSLIAPPEQQLNWSLAEFNSHAMQQPLARSPALVSRRQEEHAAFEAAFGRASSSSSLFAQAEVPPKILGVQMASIPTWSNEFRERASHGPTLEEAASWEAEFQTALEVESHRADVSPASATDSKQTAGKDEDVVGLEDQFQDFLKHAQEIGDPSWMDGFNAAWKNISPATTDMQEGSAEWGSSDWAEELERADAAAKANTTSADPDPVTAPLLDYIFEAVNPYLSHPNPLQEGIDILARHGALSDAALAFEAACQRRTSSDAWMLLGCTQAEDEKEGPAIAALQRSVKENPENAPALMVC